VLSSSVASVAFVLPPVIPSVLLSQPGDKCYRVHTLGRARRRPTADEHIADDFPGRRGGGSAGGWGGSVSQPRPGAWSEGTVFVGFDECNDASVAEELGVGLRERVGRKLQTHLQATASDASTPLGTHTGPGFDRARVRADRVWFRRVCLSIIISSASVDRSFEHYYFICVCRLTL